MGVSLIYIAIPPSSMLYARLQREKPFAILMFSLFSLSEIEPEEANGILEWMIEDYQDTFRSELEADQLIAEFQTELRRTRQAYPGIEDRTAILEKSSNENMERLIRELSRRRIANADEIVEKLIFGDQSFAPTLLLEAEPLRLISREIVSEGARILQQIDPKTLFSRDKNWEGWCLNHLEYWRNLYLLTVEKNEEILIKVS